MNLDEDGPVIASEALMKRLYLRLSVAAVLLALLSFTAQAASAAFPNTASLRVQCTATTTSSGGTSTSSSTLSVSGGGTKSGSASGTVPSGGTVTCRVLLADPDNATASAVNFTPTSTGPSGERTDIFTAGVPGQGSITYRITNGTANHTLTFRYTITVATAASGGASLRVTCATPRDSATLSASASSGTATSTRTAGSVPSGGTVTCTVEHTDPNTATATAGNFLPASTGPAGERVDVFTAGAAGPGSISYRTTNGSTSATVTFNYTITAT